MAQTKTTPFPPAGFTITQYVPPTPAEQAAEIVKTKKVEEMSFAEWELVLSEGKPEDVDKVWSVLKGKPLQMVAQVISVASPTNLKLAGSSDDIDAKARRHRPDHDRRHPGPADAERGRDFQFEGTPVSYEPKPFVMTMKDGAILIAKAPRRREEAPGSQETHAASVVESVQAAQKICIGQPPGCPSCLLANAG